MKYIYLILIVGNRLTCRLGRMNIEWTQIYYVKILGTLFSFSNDKLQSEMLSDVDSFWCFSKSKPFSMTYCSCTSSVMS